MKDVMAMILAGGQGDRLSVLSEERAKPAVIFGGRYRIIDFALSNCANSEITRVGVLTQYRPRSLNDHIGIGRPWNLDREEGRGVHLLQPYLGRAASDWYSGTADAVYQNIYYVEESKAELILILAGDHIYTMQYDKLIEAHRQSEAEVSVPVTTVPWEDASRFGTLFLDDDDRVIAFDEKPAKPRSNLISMGIYLFNRETLVQSLVDDAARGDSEHDFGRNVVPRLVGDPARRVFGYRFDGYWRDVGTIASYFDSNMDLLDDIPKLNLYDRASIIRTESIRYPPVKTGGSALVRRSMLSVGCVVNGTVERSVLSPGVYVEAGATLRDAIVFHDTRIESGAVVERSIIDKEVNLGAGCHVGFGDDWTPNAERPDIVEGGISIIGKRAVVPPGVRIGRNCVIGAGVVARAPEGDYIPSGTTLRAEGGASPFSV